MRKLLVGLLVSLCIADIAYAEGQSKITPEITSDSIGWILIALAVALGMSIRIVAAHMLQQNLYGPCSLDIFLVSLILPAVLTTCMTIYTIVLRLSPLRVVFYSLFHVGLVAIGYLIAHWIKYRATVH